MLSRRRNGISLLNFVLPDVPASILPLYHTNKVVKQPYHAPANQGDSANCCNEKQRNRRLKNQQAEQRMLLFQFIHHFFTIFLFIKRTSIIAIPSSSAFIIMQGDLKILRLRLRLS